MRNNVQTPRSRAVLIGLCVAVAFAWAVAVYMTYQDNKMGRYEVAIKPGPVSYGTHSTVSMPPMISTPIRRSVPMISGDAVRHYAHQGHATMPSANAGVSSGFRMHTTSSATVHSIGGGGSAGGGMMGSSSSASASRGIRYSGGSVSMPTLAFATSSYATQTAATASRYGIGPRKAKPTGGGTDGEWQNGGEGDADWWYWSDWEGDEGDWVAASVGDRRPAGDGVNFYRYDGGGVWTLVNNQGDPVTPVPVGTMPWMLMLLLVSAYTVYIYRKNTKTHLI